MNLVFENSVALIQFLMYGGAFVVMALLAMQPTSGLADDVFTAGATLLVSGMSHSSTLAGQLSALVYGHAALIQVADVFNEHEKHMSKSVSEHSLRADA